MKKRPRKGITAQSHSPVVKPQTGAELSGLVMNPYARPPIQLSRPLKPRKPSRGMWPTFVQRAIGGR
jgi:hypothetical protein